MKSLICHAALAPTVPYRDPRRMEQIEDCLVERRSGAETAAEGPLKVIVD